MATGTNGIATKQDLWNLMMNSSHQVSNPTKCFVFSIDSSDTDLFGNYHSFTYAPQASSNYSNGQCVKYSDIYFYDKPTTTHAGTGINTQLGRLVIAFSKGNCLSNHRWYNQTISLTPPTNATVVGFNASNTPVGNATAIAAEVYQSTISVGFSLQSLSFLSQCKKLTFGVSGTYYASTTQYALFLPISSVTVNWPLS